jgi:hypothetical protein
MAAMARGSTFPWGVGSSKFLLRLKSQQPSQPHHRRHLVPAVSPRPQRLKCRHLLTRQRLLLRPDREQIACMVRLTRYEFTDYPLPIMWCEEPRPGDVQGTTAMRSVQGNVAVDRRCD